MTNEIFGGAVLTALLMCDSHVMSATKVAPPILPFLLLWDSAPSLAEGARVWVIASEQRERGNQSCAKLESWDSVPFDCFGYRLAMTMGIFCHVERSETSLLDSVSLLILSSFHIFL